MTGGSFHPWECGPGPEIIPEVAHDVHVAGARSCKCPTKPSDTAVKGVASSRSEIDDTLRRLLGEAFKIDDYRFLLLS